MLRGSIWLSVAVVAVVSSLALSARAQPMGGPMVASPAAPAAVAEPTPMITPVPEAAPAQAMPEAADSASDNDAVKAEDQAAQGAYQAHQAQDEAEKAEAAAYAAQLAEHDAKVAADMAAWHARVKACSEGDRTQCGQ